MASPSYGHPPLLQARSQPCWCLLTALQVSSDTIWVEAVTHIYETDLQQSKADAAKVMLRISAQAPNSPEPEAHIFIFTSATAARAEADAIKDALQSAISAAQAEKTLKATPGDNSSSAAMAIAGAVSSTPGAGKATKSWYDDNKLMQDASLHLSLLKANPALAKTFAESQRTKPDSITKAQFSAQFWSTRLPLLRAHAIEKGQSRGTYNVLSTIKEYTVDNEKKVDVGREQIHLIFNLHPLVKRVYDENVPPLSETKFWSRFFQSRLFKRLKGEKIVESDSLDNVLDKYLQDEDDTERAKRVMSAHVPHIIDVEGNEQNHSQRKGNRFDRTMRTETEGAVPLYKTLNALSEKLLAQVAPHDVDPSLPIGLDEETFNSLALRDLQGDAEENRVILNIKDQNRFFDSDKHSSVSADALRYAKQDPAKVLQSLKADLAQLSSNTNLQTAIGVQDDSDTDSDADEPSASKKPHVGSKASITAATAQILSAISERRVRSDDFSPTSQTASTAGLSQPVYDSLSVCHATTTEFLQHFWSVFLSGDAARAGEIASRLESLERAIGRIKAIADAAELERQAEIDRIKRQVQEHFEKTGKRKKMEYESTPGGAKAVNQLLAPTIKAIEVATKEYRKALAEQSQDGAGR